MNTHKTLNTKHNNRQLVQYKTLYRYLNSKNTNTIVIQCRNSYEQKLIHEKAELVGLKHIGVIIPNVSQNKIQKLEFTEPLSPDHPICKIYKVKKEEKKCNIYGIKLEKKLNYNSKI